MIVLSPFTVSADSDTGYEGTSSLAGTGLNTKLTDIGSSVSVITARFLEDTASTNLRDLLVYQTALEASGFGGNLSGTGPSPGGVTNEPSLSAGLPGTRVRGLAAATQARNLFRNNIPMDSYNTERVEINRGANAILFGVGSPAGIINTTTVSANLRKNTGSVELSTGSYDSRRGVVRVNQVVLPDELAFFFAAVIDEQRFQQKYTYVDSERVYLAGTWDVARLRDRGILSSTRLRASMESGNVEANRPRVLTPSDRLSAWFDETLPEDLRAAGARGKVAYDPTSGSNTFTRALGNATIGVIDQVNRSPTIFFQDPVTTTPTDNVGFAGSAEPVIGRAMVSTNTFFPTTNRVGTAVHAYARELSRVRSDYGLRDQAFYTSENLKDPSIFNFFDYTLQGPNSESIAKLQVVDVTLEQLLLDRQAGFELSYSKQRWDESQQGLMQQQRPYISIDVNTRMWTGEPNPNFGRPFISTAGFASYTQPETETQRAKAFYRLDLTEKIEGRLGWWLGAHTFSGLLQDEVSDNDQRDGGSTHYTPDAWPNGGNQRTFAQAKQIVTWAYLAPSLATASTPVGAHIPGLQTYLLDFQNNVRGTSVITRTQAPNATVAREAQYAPRTLPITILREDREVTNTASTATRSRRQLESQAASYQANLLGDSIVGTLGIRKEKAELKSVLAPIDPREGNALVFDPAYSIYNDTVPVREFEETLSAWSVVAKTPASWLRHVPVISAFNVYTGKSENFSPPAGNTITAFGDSLPPPQGETEERGVYLELFDGKVATRVNFYKTTQANEVFGGVNSVASQIVKIHRDAFEMVRLGLLPNGGNGLPVGYVAPPAQLLETFQVRVNEGGRITNLEPTVRDTSDFTTKGAEVEVSFRPTKGLSFVFNVAKQESVRSNMVPNTRRLLYQTPTASGDPLAVEWQKPWALQIPLLESAIGKEGTLDQSILTGYFLRNAFNPTNTAISSEGALAQELRRYSANFVGNYQFQDGRLKGWAIGTGVRWQDKAAIGYPVATFEDDLSPSDGIDEVSDVRVSDVRSPFYGPRETRYDAWVSYQTRLFKKKYPVRFQLNVRNIGIHDQLYPVVANPDGRVAVWGISESERYTFTARISY